MSHLADEVNFKNAGKNPLTLPTCATPSALNLPKIM